MPAQVLEARRDPARGGPDRVLSPGARAAELGQRVLEAERDDDLLVRQAVCALFISSGAVADRLHHQPSEATAIIPSADCPYIAKVCELIADPAVRNYVGFAEYAWDFNAPDRMEIAEPVEHPSTARLARADRE